MSLGVIRKNMAKNFLQGIIDEMPQADQKDYLKARNKVVNDFIRTTYGNDWKDAERIQTLSFNPIHQYSCGILFPQKVIHEHHIESEDNNNEFDKIESQDEPNNKFRKELKAPVNNDEGDDDELNTIDLSTQSKPSSFGINFVVDLNETLEIKLGYSQYIIKKDKDNNLISPAEWTQNKFIHEVSISCSESFDNKYFSDDKLLLNMVKRKKDNNFIVSLSLSNQNKFEGKKIDSKDAFFNVGIIVKTKNSSFFPIDSSINSSVGDEKESMDLLFREKKSYASGNGCAADWIFEDNACKEINTTFIPIHETSTITAREGDFRMSNFADFDDNKGLLKYSQIENLISDYDIWYDTQKSEATKLEEKYNNASLRHIKAIDTYKRRMKKGLELLKQNPELDKAFKLTNLAMLIQFNRGKNLKKKNNNDELLSDDKSFLKKLTSNDYDNMDGSWRPFQLAFLLTCIPDIADPKSESSFKDLVDLIWFPTGGGKTEAYLGVLAFTVIIRRMRNKDNAGVTAIMRYTLRLLTSDQFRRASGLICALEYIRREKIFDIDLGSEEISIGLWIGQKASPKNDEAAGRWLNDPKMKDNQGNFKFILNECPWCKTDLIAKDSPGYKIVPKNRKKKVIVHCSDDSCFFSNNLPIYLWEETIFEKKPTLLLSTVDSLTKLAWRKGASALFKDENFSPPELIIQDELHLISGPLGSVMGLFEVALLKLLTREQYSPKIIGASATLTFSDTHSKSLYSGRSSAIFPPQGLKWGDSFFAEEKDNDKLPGRMYLGYFGSMKGSMVESAFGASVPLLQSPQQILPTSTKDAKKGEKEVVINILGNLRVGGSFSIYQGGKPSIYKINEIIDMDNDYGIIINLDEPLTSDIKSLTSIFPAITKYETAIDPYGTLIWYFNSKKELATVLNQKIRLVNSLRDNSKRINKGRLGPVESPSKFSRKLDNCEELTGRLSQDEIGQIVENLRKPWTQNIATSTFKGMDIVYSTNMISVGVDISRLGLMMVHGQPRTTAEYIQSTSRVGREFPGLVLTVYNHNKSKDRSIYEQFNNYHQSLYRFVEGISITPFSRGSITRALPAVFISLVRSFFEIEDPNIKGQSKVVKEIKDWILEAVKNVDPEESSYVEKELEYIIKKWESSNPADWGEMRGNSDSREMLMNPNSSQNTVFGDVPTSMRSTAKEVNIELFRKENF